jgi:hypothetical protein
VNLFHLYSQKWVVPSALPDCAAEVAERAAAAAAAAAEAANVIAAGSVIDLKSGAVTSSMEGPPAAEGVALPSITLSATADEGGAVDAVAEEDDDESLDLSED